MRGVPPRPPAACARARPRRSSHPHPSMYAPGRAAPCCPALIGGRIGRRGASTVCCCMQLLHAPPPATRREGVPCVRRATRDATALAGGAHHVVRGAPCRVSGCARPRHRPCRTRQTATTRATPIPQATARFCAAATLPAASPLAQWCVLCGLAGAVACAPRPGGAHQVQDRRARGLAPAAQRHALRRFAARRGEPALALVRAAGRAGEQRYRPHTCASLAQRGSAAICRHSLCAPPSAFKVVWRFPAPVAWGHAAGMPVGRPSNQGADTYPFGYPGSVWNSHAAQCLTMAVECQPQTT